ncbi:MAG: NAD-dependent epimerase/dehydratase [Microgenomates group bacterium GW2011_GWA2_44_7]|nr:MAG: NAD-dependent epimerase/dehydratase [Microgenomates group bacterium GW2011_GWA2_44_7]
MINFYKGKKVLVTGGMGFIGSFVCELLLNKGANVLVTFRKSNFDNIVHIKKDLKLIKTNLLDYKDAKKATKNIDAVLNLASKVAGIQYNIDHPVEMFGDNVIIAKNMIEASYRNNVDRFLIVSSACVYPRFASVPTEETEGFIDDPEPTNLGYGWAKRVAELMGRFYFQEYGMKVAIARPYNAYGPRDNFDPSVSHVIPGIIKRVFDGENPLVVWGSGKQTRSFLYAEDFARGLLTVTEKYPVADPINIGTDEEVTIGNLAKMIVEISGKDIDIKFDTTKPDGQPRRNCDTKKALDKVNFKAQIRLRDGLERTIAWYKKQL